MPTVLIVTNSAYSLGGLAIWLQYLLPGLRKRGWRAVLGLVEGPRHHRPDRYVETYPDEDWVRIPCSTGTPRGRRESIRRVARQLQPDAVLSVNIPDCLAAVAELRADGRVHSRAVMTCHGIQPDLYADMELLRDSMDAIVCTNRLACELAQEVASWPAARVLYAPCGTELHSPNRSISKAPLRLVYSGRLEEGQKRIGDLAQIISELEASEVPFQLRIAGDGPDDGMLRQRLAPSVSRGTVEFLGRVPPNRLSEFVYDRGDVLLLTSLWETGPIVVWEAMAHGLAVVSSRYIGSGRETALRHRDNALLFDIGDTQAAVRLIRELHHNREWAAHIARAGWNLTRDRYTTNVSVQMWADALTSILEQPLRSLHPPTIRAGAGRLDRLLGEQRAETLRRVLRRTGADHGAGGEWPHRISDGDIDESAFWRIAAELDGLSVMRPSSAEAEIQT